MNSSHLKFSLQHAHQPHKAINDRIKELDIQDCKVRVTNVDSQSSDSSIIIQVIGEISNKSAPHRKFTQTFVLAKQTNGYYVLNDIFRYIVEDEEFEGHGDGEDLQQNQAVPSGTQEPAPSVEDTEPRTLTNSEDPAAREHDASKVDKELEEKVLQEDTANSQESDVPVDGAATIDTENVQPAEEAPAAAVPAVAEEITPATEPQTGAAAEEFVPEKPKDPEPSPVASTPPDSTVPSAISAPPPKPVAPKTWANLAAAAHNRIATPVTPVVRSTPSPAANQAKAPPPVQASTTSAPTAPAAQTASSEAQAPADSSPQDEWQPVNHDHSKRQSRAQPAASEPQNSRAYIKNVYESVPGDELRKTLEKYGEVAYFDISRQKVSASVSHIRVWRC